MDKKAPGKLTNACYELAEVMVSAIFVIALMFLFFFRFAGVVGESMVPTLNDKDWLAVSATPGNPARGDVVIISQPNAHNEPLVKRVIALEGETIALRDGFVYIDGQLLNESAYLAEDVRTYPAPEGMSIADVVDGEMVLRIPKGYVFVMGDNRMNSSDSRFTDVQLINENYILGKVMLRLRPFGQFFIAKRAALSVYPYG
ncbi:MAG: signal peptidase I [Oscillospiraceae bacterium]|jgi:signal peptidase I|nr:signal peptidase I [Oscillospiraceae bacterium]